MLCFYCVATEKYCGVSEFEVLGSVPKSQCSIVLEICPTPNTTLNIPDSVEKCKTDKKIVFVDATVPFELPYMQI